MRLCISAEGGISSDFCPPSIGFKYISCLAQLVTGIKERQVSLPVERSTLYTMLLNHTEGGRDGGRLCDKHCTYTVLVSTHREEKLSCCCYSEHQISSSLTSAKTTLVYQQHAHNNVEINNYMIHSIMGMFITKSLIS